MRHHDQIRADLGTIRTPDVLDGSGVAARIRLLHDIPHLLAAAEAVNRLCDDLEATGDPRDEGDSGNDPLRG
jgi:hypothetical protein